MIRNCIKKNIKNVEVRVTNLNAENFAKKRKNPL